MSQPHYPLDICTHHVQQNTGPRGKASAADADLLHWANDPLKRLTCCVVFVDLDGQGPSLVLRLDRATCVSYSEHFQPDASGNVAYFCQLSIVAERFTKQGTEFLNNWPS
ncbi:type VI secretion system tube protein TssD [Hymenobacter psoromatis]|uniref:type VI secretion system tube protein TssD n=1 Tax=Hymenobacter psoromatis TaxID=1484116 RepID=UPI001CBB20FC|nr:type VI secretion system tube protein TssD [Hymenobacter psoromatis]